MNRVIRAKDCRPIVEETPDLTPEEKAWLARLGAAITPETHVIGIGEHKWPSEQPVVYCERDGNLWCGRYVGSIRFEGRTLQIMPRLGMATLARWLELALNLVFTDVEGTPREHDVFLPELLARIWSRALVGAARHGLPALREEEHHHGFVIRGQIDVRRTIQARLAGRAGLSSVQRTRSLANPVVRALVAGYVTLERGLGRARLSKVISERARQLVDGMIAAVPRSAGPPDEMELERVRYTPLTAAFRPLVRLSMRLARRRGLFQGSEPDGTCAGVLLDVAELWELYILSCLRAAFPTVEVLHGTRDEAANDWLLVSTHNGATLGRLKPDALVRDGERNIVVDAKYKSLRSNWYRRQGVEREDLYQLVAYLSRFASAAGEALLVYPAESGPIPQVIADGPWRLGTSHILRFIALPVEAEQAVIALRGLAPYETEALKTPTL